MTPYIGQILLNLAALLALIPLVRHFSFATLKRLYILQAIVIGIAFAWLIKSHLMSDFSLLNVVQHSHTQKPWLYKIAGTWGNHEGSMLLWTVFMTFYGLFSFKKYEGEESVAQTRAILHSLLNFLFVCFMVLVCDPFTAVATPPLEGRDLNPLLQDPLLAIHPPFLYAGYIGLNVPFIYALSNLVHRHTFALWIPNLRAMVLLPWTLLTIGLGLGSFWAYYELGWGGWWFWDPVENTALVPWLLGLILLHCLQRYKHRNEFQRQIIVLVILSFISSIGGTFLVRSGLFTSVHSFAVDPERGFFLLGIILFILSGTFLILYKSEKEIVTTVPLQLNNRADFIRMGVIFTGAGVITIVFGTLYPLLSSYFGYPITVGGPYFQMTFVPMILPVLAFIPLIPWLGWKETAWQKVIQKVAPSLTVTGFIIVSLWYFSLIKTGKEILFAGVALWIMMSTLFSINRAKLSQSFIGMSLAHFGIGMVILGMVLSSANEQEMIKALKVGEEIQLAAYNLKLDKVEAIEGPNFISQKAIIYLERKGMKQTLSPEKRFYWTQGIIHGETAIYSSLLDHVYIAIGEQYENDIWSLKLYYKPYINFLWLGMIIIAIAGLFLLKRKAKFLTLGLILCIHFPATAMEAHEVLTDPVAETRAYHLGKMILCPTCAGQNINDSVADEAIKMRKEVRQLILQGVSDSEVLDHYISLHGERIVYQPSFNLINILLWAFPWMLFLGMIGYVLRQRRRVK